MGILKEINAAGLTGSQIVAAVRAVERFAPTGSGSITVNGDLSDGLVIGDDKRDLFVDSIRAGIIQKGPPPKGYQYAGQFGTKDFTTAQYWVGSSAQGAGLGVGQFKPVPSPDYHPQDDAWVPATNLAEWEPKHGGTHLLKAGQAVIIYHLQSADGADFYAINLTPPVNVIVKITGTPGATDAPGEYLTASILTGQATGMPPAGMTDPGIDNAIIENAAEAGFSNAAGKTIKPHWFTNGGQRVFPGYIVGVTTDNPPKYRVVITAPNPFALFDVTVTKDGSGVAPAFQYEVKDLLGNTLGTDIIPVWSVPPSSAPGTNGQGYYDASGDFQLATVDQTQDGAHFEVNLTTDGGANGTGAPVANATYTYTVKDLAGNTLGTGESPVWARPQGKLIGPATHGSGYYSAGTFHLATTDEQGALFAC